MADWLSRPLGRRILLLLLVSLTATSCWLPPGQAMEAALLLAQYGLLLIWQPVFRQGEPLRRHSLVGVLALGGLLVFLGNWILPIWIALLAALVASQAAAWRGRWPQRFHFGLLVFLLLLLWLRAMPMLAHLAPPFASAVAIVLPLMLLVLACFPASGGEIEQRQPLDFFYGLLVLLMALLTGVVALLLAALGRVDYPAALALSMLGMGGGLGVLGWLWNPRGGFAGLGALFSARMLELGTPFERWSARMAGLAARQDNPADFLTAAVETLVELPGISGGEWQCDGVVGRFGDKAGYSATLHANGLRLVLYSESVIPPALRVQFQLVAELLRQFHQSKERERRLADYIYIEAVHETGARLTHDIKNLLQTLKGLVGAASANADPAQLVALYGRQLPEIARRLESTLARLTAPVEQVEDMVDVAVWWRAAQASHHGERIHFAALPSSDGRLDAPLFDSVLSNLLRNAMEKRAVDGEGMAIACGLWRVGERWLLWVEDAGSPVPTAVADDLFERPVASAGGYGLGLFQMARLAKGRGYALQLASNRPGAVRFHLVPA